MAYRSYSGGGFSGHVTRWVRWLLIVNTAVFAALLMAELFRVAPLTIYDWLALNPTTHAVVRPWTVLTYAFLHAGVFHWMFNMFALYFFGPRLEDRWGSREFMRFYLLAAAGGALFSFLTPVFGTPGYVLGASAAINGLLMAWAVYWPDDEVLLLGIFPIRILWLVIGLGFFSMFSAMAAAGDGVAHLAHLGGFLVALAYLKSPWAPRGWGDLPARPGKKKRRNAALVAWAGKKQDVAAPPPAAAKGGTTRRQERELLDDVDRILDKISEHGLGSLTPEERARLDEVSKRYRTN
jgi:membrane associated rhomboid family serine protease